MMNKRGKKTSPVFYSSFTVHHSSFSASRQGGGLDLQQGAHAVDQLLDLERLVQEVVGPGQAQLLDLVLLDHAADAEDAHVFQGRVGADAVADLLAVDVGQHHVQHDQVGPVLLDHHAGVEAGGGNAHLK